MEQQNIFVRHATVADLDRIAPLFDAYRQFYGQSPDLNLAREFIRERLEQNQSVILLALGQDGSAAGFTQLYPSFSSASAKRIFILNDLFVAPAARRCGVGRALLEAAADFGRSAGAVRLTLSTAHTNTSAQSLYDAQRMDSRRSIPQLPLGALAAIRGPVTARRHFSILPREW